MGCFRRSHQCLKYCSIMGAHFVVAPVSFLWIYGNLSTYVDSYNKFVCSPQCMDGDSIWTVGLRFAMICPGTLITKPLATKIGYKLTGVAAAIIVNASLFASVWAVSFSEAGSTLLGALIGLVQGLTSTIAFEYISGWAPEKSSLFMATITAASALISVPQNQIITKIVNPRNLKPDVTQGSRTYFSQQEILERVPRALFVFAAMTLGLQFIGYLLLAPQAKPPTDDQIIIGTSRKEEHEKTVQTGKPLAKSLTMNSLKASKLQIHFDAEEHHTLNTTRSSNMETYPLNPAKAKPRQEQTSLTPAQVLRTPLFYAVFIFGMATMYAFFLREEYYKQFGLLYTHNDYYLTIVCTLTSIVVAASNFILGLALIGGGVSIKGTIIFSLSINCVLCAFWYIVPQFSAMLYMLLILCLAGVQSLFYTILPAVTLQKFGPAHFCINYGMLLSCLLIMGFIGPAIASPLLQSQGWHWLFTSATTLCLLSLMFVVCVDFNLAKDRTNE